MPVSFIVTERSDDFHTSAASPRPDGQGPPWQVAAHVVDADAVVARALQGLGRTAAEPRVTEHRDVSMHVGSAILFQADGTAVRESTYLHPGVLDINLPVAPVTLEPDVTHVVAYNGGWRNYYHWTIQCAFSAYVMQHRLPRPPGEQLFVFPDVNPPARALLSLSGIPDQACRFFHKDASLTLPRASTISTVYGGFVYRPSPLLADFAREVVSQAGDAPGRRRRWLYVSRSDTHKRRMENEEHLERLLANKGFDVVRNSELTVEEQVRLFNDADVVVGPHGAGLTNVIYTRSGTKVLELSSAGYVNPCFLHLAVPLGLRYRLDLHGPYGKGTHASTWRVNADVVLQSLESMEIL